MEDPDADTKVRAMQFSNIIVNTHTHKTQGVRKVRVNIRQRSSEANKTKGRRQNSRTEIQKSTEEQMEKNRQTGKQ